MIKSITAIIHDKATSISETRYFHHKISKGDLVQNGIRGVAQRVLDTLEKDKSYRLNYKTIIPLLWELPPTHWVLEIAVWLEDGRLFSYDADPSFGESLLLLKLNEGRSKLEFENNGERIKKKTTKR